MDWSTLAGCGDRKTSRSNRAVCLRRRDFDSEIFSIFFRTFARAERGFSQRRKKRGRGSDGSLGMPGSGCVAGRRSQPGCAHCSAVGGGTIMGAVLVAGPVDRRRVEGSPVVDGTGIAHVNRQRGPDPAGWSRQTGRALAWQGGPRGWQRGSLVATGLPARLAGPGGLSGGGAERHRGGVCGRGQNPTLSRSELARFKDSRF
jgi:hypothetical protein